MSDGRPVLRLELDGALRRYDEGRTLLGGAPLRVMRLSDAGVRQVARWESGEPVPDTGRASELAHRLLDAGMAHPRWSSGPFDAEDVTAVVPVRDDPAGVRATVEALAGVAAVIVVDDGSADPAAIEAAAGSSTVVRRDRTGGPGVARETGRTHVETPLVAFVDADCSPEPGWLDALLTHFADPAVVAAAPRVRSRAGETLLERYEALRSPLDLGERPARVTPGGAVTYVPTACLLARADVEAFDPDLRFGEDVDLVWRMIANGGVVRYEPAATAWHRPRADWRAWVRQRIGYGSAAAPLAVRHGRVVAPLRISRWSAAAWALAALRHPVAAVLAAVWSAAALPRRLSSTGLRGHEAFRFALAGHLHAGRWIATAVRRTWWPIAALAALCARRVRPVVLAVALVPATYEWMKDRPGIDPVRYVLLRLGDDLAYGAGVWRGCAGERSVTALVPVLAEWPGRGGPVRERPTTSR